MRRVYNQKNLSILVNGIPMQDFAEGTTVTYTEDGGEVQKTQGTDGAGINIATKQGATLTLTLRETSRSRGMLHSLNFAQYYGASGVTVVVRTGADVLHTMTGAFVGPPGTLTTGDKVQAGMEYTLISPENESSNLETLASEFL